VRSIKYYDCARRDLGNHTAYDYKSKSMQVIGDIDAMDWGIPCIAFSGFNKDRKKLGGCLDAIMQPKELDSVVIPEEVSDEEDEEVVTQSATCWKYGLVLVKRKRPGMIFIENVKGFSTYGDLQTVVETLREAGYVVCCRLLNSEMWKLPNTRHRFYLSGIHFTWLNAPCRNLTHYDMTFKQVNEKFQKSFDSAIDELATLLHPRKISEFFLDMDGSPHTFCEG
jgi:site-specific DNA-cytosine methylase